MKTFIDKHDVSLREIRSPYELQTSLGGVDRFYSALPYVYDQIDFADVELFATIHGLRPLELPTDRYEYRYDRSMRGWAKYVGKHVLRRWYVGRHRRRFRDLVLTSARRKTFVVPSQHTKYAILDTFPDVDGEDIRVLYSPQRQFRPETGADDLIQRGVSPGRYVLLVSGGRWIKNAYRAVHALDELFRRQTDVDLEVVITGVGDESSIFGSLRNEERFHFLDYVERPVLESLYKHAYCLLYPTLNEGFGYPPLEAMRYGTPVVCSSVTSLPEICQDAALFVNPYSAPEIRNRVLRLVRSQDAYSRYSERATRRHTKVSDQQQGDLDDLCRLLLA
ncbi:glycosyltransferase [Salinibacter ruber]|uniref:glycosyltransferase n=1 Tax=Salinibacter ruber TaxID=146919 RepID=UPI002450F5A7|nr:glycosyltransferase involved in cell wall biosynthesis [Salinibacter ruber]